MFRPHSNAPDKAMTFADQFKGKIVTPEFDYYPAENTDSEPSVDRQKEL